MNFKTRGPVPLKKRIRNGIILFFIGCIANLALEPGMLVVREYRVESPDLPIAFRGFRIAFLADIHYSQYFPIERVRDLVDRTNALKPDLVLLGGDYICGGPELFSACAKELGSLAAPCGVYAVLGNHDHYAGAAAARAAFSLNGITGLDNAGVWIGKDKARIRLGGVDDLDMGRQVLSATTKGTVIKDFVLLVSHNPDFAERVPPGAIDLMLSGHTHGGQVTFFGLYAPVLPTRTGQKYRSGLVETNGFRVIVSNGIGVIPPAVRFFAPPQIVVVVLEKE